MVTFGIISAQQTSGDAFALNAGDVLKVGIVIPATLHGKNLKSISMLLRKTSSGTGSFKIGMYSQSDYSEIQNIFVGSESQLSTNFNVLKINLSGVKLTGGSIIAIERSSFSINVNDPAIVISLKIPRDPNILTWIQAGGVSREWQFATAYIQIEYEDTIIPTVPQPSIFAVSPSVTNYSITPLNAISSSIQYSLLDPKYLGLNVLIVRNILDINRVVIDTKTLQTTLKNSDIILFINSPTLQAGKYIIQPLVLANYSPYEFEALNEIGLGEVILDVGSTTPPVNNVKLQISILQQVTSTKFDIKVITDKPISNNFSIYRNGIKLITGSLVKLGDNEYGYQITLLDNQLNTTRITNITNGIESIPSNELQIDTRQTQIPLLKRIIVQTKCGNKELILTSENFNIWINANNNNVLGSVMSQFAIENNLSENINFPNQLSYTIESDIDAQSTMIEGLKFIWNCYLGVEQPTANKKGKLDTLLFFLPLAYIFGDSIIKEKKR